MTNTPMQPARRRSKVPNLLFKIGAAATLLSLVMVIVGVVFLGDRLTEGTDEGALIRDGFTTEVAVPDIVDVHLEAGTYDIVAVGNDLVRRDEITPGDRNTAYRDRNDFPEPKVTIDRNGAPVIARQPTGTTLLPQDGYDLVRLSTFDVTSFGTYRIVVDGGSGPVTTIGIGETDDGDVVTEATGGLLFVFGLLGLGLGVLLLIAAGLWLFAGRRPRRTPPSGGPPPSSSPPTDSAPDDFDSFGGIQLPPGIHTDPLTGRTSSPGSFGSAPPPPPPPRRAPPPPLHHGNQPPSSTV